MSFFVSGRERYLWLWTLITVVAIYSTLGLAQSFAGALSESGVFGVGFFITACLLVLAAAVTQGLTKRPGGIEIMVALGIVAVYLLVFVRMTIPAERTHLIEYGVVALFIYEALTERVKQGRDVPVPAILAVLLTSLVGVIDESIQALLPSRVFDPLDILFNLVAAAMAVGASTALAWASRKAHKDR